ncbi:hypothetical protein RWJ89_26275 [Rhizobium sp. 10PS4]|uniref:hypothetical protein n=1 Tax=Rhizobium laguerreae TaxID=1076926 RepID=UPI001FE20C94|nr:MULTISPECIES: hypothetical protein [Rhizobium]MDU0310718.1 hypothetical protein [Rhizobium sp. 10PS4]
MTLATDQSVVRKVKKQFENLRPKREVRRAQLDGNDLDMDAVVRSRIDLRATGEPNDHIYECARPAAHELATTILVDVSLSTDSWVDNRRVLDVEMQALDVLSRGLDACGDRFSVQTFTSRRRTGFASTPSSGSMRSSRRQSLAASPASGLATTPAWARRFGTSRTSLTSRALAIGC